jgi:hypothetical protein
MRPHRASPAMSTIGENVQRMPAADASSAATRAARSSVTGSQVAESPSGTGKRVRNPWITASPKRSGMRIRDSSIAIRCNRLLSDGLVTFRNDPTSPRRAASSKSLRPVPGPVGIPFEYWFNCPTFSSRVIFPRSSSIRRSMAGLSLQVSAL